MDIGGIEVVSTGSRLLTADEVAELTAHIERLESENARLREELADAPKCEACEAMLDCDECLRADGSHKERRRLSIENAKLRDQLSRRTAKRIVVSNRSTDCATGHTECSGCHGVIDFFDNYCRHCGARLEGGER